MSDHIYWRGWFPIFMVSFARGIAVIALGTGLLAMLDEIGDQPLPAAAGPLVVFAMVPFAIGSSIPTRLIGEQDRLIVTNGLSKKIIRRGDVAHLEWRAPPLFFLQPVIRVMPRSGPPIDIFASMSFQDGQRARRARELKAWLWPNNDASDCRIRTGRAYRRDMMVYPVLGPSVLVAFFVSDYLDAVPSVALGLAVAVPAFFLARRFANWMASADADIVR